MSDGRSAETASEAASRRVLLWAAAAAVFAAALPRAYVNGDAMLYVASGRFVVEHGALPSVDPFSYVSTKGPLLLHMLLPMIGFSVVESTWGLAALALVTSLWVTATFGLALALVARTSASLWLCGFAFALLLLVDKEVFEVRGQAYAYAPLILLTLCVGAVMRGHVRAAAIGLPLGLWWALTHPSFPFGVFLPLGIAAGVALLEPRRERVRIAPLVGLAVLFLIGACATPYGTDLLVDVLALVGDPTTSRIAHMRSPPPSALWLLFVAHAVVGIVAAQLWGPRRYRRALGLVGVLLVGMTLVSRRYAIYLVVVEALWLVPLARGVAAQLNARVVRAVNAALTIALSAFAWVSLSEPLPDVDEDLPVAAAAALEASGAGDPVLTEFAWGGYLMSRWGEERPIFIDGRNNLYGNGVFEDYLVLVHAPERADVILDLYGVQTVLWMRDWKLTAHLRARPDRWRVRYEDAEAIVFERLGLTDDVAASSAAASDAQSTAEAANDAVPNAAAVLRDPSRTRGSSPTP